MLFASCILFLFYGCRIVLKVSFPSHVLAFARCPSRTPSPDEKRTAIVILCTINSTLVLKPETESPRTRRGNSEEEFEVVPSASSPLFLNKSEQVCTVQFSPKQGAIYRINLEAGFQIPGSFRTEEEDSSIRTIELS